MKYLSESLKLGLNCLAIVLVTLVFVLNSHAKDGDPPSVDILSLDNSVRSVSKGERAIQDRIDRVREKEPALPTPEVRSVGRDSLKKEEGKQFVRALKQDLKKKGKPAKKLVSNAEAYLADKDAPAEVRYRIDRLLRESKLRERKFASSKEVRAVREADARALMRGYHDLPGGFSYMLAVAKSYDDADATRVAEELLRSGAPKRIRDGARRVMARQAMVGRKLETEGVDIDAYNGKNLIIYSWTSRRPPANSLMLDFDDFDSLAFIGICLDRDVEAAKACEWVSQLPGIQIYDAGWLEGPVARQLNLTIPYSIYIIDPSGTVTDVAGHRDFPDKLASLLGFDLTAVENSFSSETGN